MTIRLYINNCYERQERRYTIKGELLHWEDKKITNGYAPNIR